MSRCELTGKSPVVKNSVSHSNIKTKGVAYPNIQRKRVYSQVLDQMFGFKMATTTLRTMEHQGGFDAFILRAATDKMSKRAKAIQKRVSDKLNKAARSA